MAKIELNGTGNFSNIVDVIVNETQKRGLTCELKDSQTVQYEDTSIAMLVFEKYFWRNKSRASLSVLVVAKDQTIKVTAISSGGSLGVFLNISWGAENAFVKMISEIIEPYGFH